MQRGLQCNNLGGNNHGDSGNNFSSTATLKILTTIADFGDSSKLKKGLLLSYANFDADETVDKLADILQQAAFLKKCDISY